MTSKKIVLGIIIASTVIIVAAIAGAVAIHIHDQNVEINNANNAAALAQQQAQASAAAASAAQAQALAAQQQAATAQAAADEAQREAEEQETIVYYVNRYHAPVLTYPHTSIAIDHYNENCNSHYDVTYGNGDHVIVTTDGTTVTTTNEWVAYTGGPQGGIINLATGEIISEMKLRCMNA